jgi:tetratricopeptide (TPR) repeat protein
LLGIGDRPRAAEADAALADVWWHRGDQTRCDEHLQRAEELTRNEPATPETAHVLAEIVRHRMLAGRYDADQGRRALELAEALGLDELRAHLLITVGTARGNAGDPEGLGAIERGLQSARAGRWFDAIVRGCSNLGTQLGRNGHLRQALELSLEAQEAAERLGSAVQVRWTRGNRIEWWIETGHWDRAAPEADRYLADSAWLGAGHDDPLVALVRACLRLARDDVDGALADHSFALERARASWEDPQTRWPALAGSACICADLGRLDEAAALLDEFLTQGQLGFDYVTFAFADLMWTADVLDRRDPVRAALAATPDRLSSAAGCALLDGDPARAAELYDSGGALRSAAVARLRYGQGRRELLEQALEFFARVGATRYQRRCDELLASPV